MAEKFDRNDLANLGVVLGFDGRYESVGFAHLMASVFKAYGIRVFCLDRYVTAPFLSYFTQKFKCLYGIMITGRDSAKCNNGCLIFNSQGHLLTE
jgi:phosphoglucomutase